MGADVQWAIFWSNIFLGFITLLAVYVALNKEDIRKPTIKIGFRNESPYAIDQYKTPTGILFRLKIVNEGKTVARNCQVKIISVKSEEGDNVLDKNEPDILKWSGSPRDMRYREDPANIGEERRVQQIPNLTPIFREKKDISSIGGSEFCDLFWIDAGKEVVFSSAGNRRFTCEDKRYFATIEISGDNFEPTLKQIKFYTPCKVDWKDNVVILLAGIEEIKHISNNR